MLRALAFFLILPGKYISINQNLEPMAFKLPDLPYAHNALEPHIDAQTMEIHHGRHHKAYTDNLNKAIEGTDADQKGIEEMLKNISFYKSSISHYRCV